MNSTTPPSGSSSMLPSNSYQQAGLKRKRISTACNACKKKKTRCSGLFPCTRCRDQGTISECEFERSTDLRRKDAFDRATQNLTAANSLLDGIIDLIRDGREPRALVGLFDLIRSNATKAELATYIADCDAKGLMVNGNPARAKSPISQASTDGSSSRSRGDLYNLLNHDDVTEDEVVKDQRALSFRAASPQDFWYH